MEHRNPALIVTAFNRPACLSRLLEALGRSLYDEVPVLVISIDYSSEYSAVLKGIAEDFSWKGEKKIVVHPDNLGLKAHILWCASLSREYGSVVVLEDDLMVSPWFYQYALQALQDTSGHANIAAVSLYAPSFNESAFLPFHPLVTASGYYLMQLPCSWGQMWTGAQFDAFSDWYETGFNESAFSSLPEGIREWSAHSWKKVYILYLQQTGRYFAYPYLSYTQNLNEIGTNNLRKDFTFHNSLAFGASFPPPFVSEVAPRYDAAGNLDPEYIREYCPALKDKQYVVDLYGKKIHLYDAEDWVLTCLPCAHPQRTFALDVQPAELNVLLDRQGEGISLVKKKHISTTTYPKRLIEYFYPVPSWYAPYFTPPFRQLLVQKAKHILREFFN